MTTVHYREAQLKPQILSMLSTPRRLAKNSKQTKIRCSPGILLPVLTLFRGSVLIKTIQIPNAVSQFTLTSPSGGRFLPIPNRS